MYSDAVLPDFEDDRGVKQNPLNDNFHKKEFQELWRRINKKAVYTVHFDTQELIKNCVRVMNDKLRITPLQYIVQQGTQSESIDYDSLTQGKGFVEGKSTTEIEKKSVHSFVPYDLIGKIAEETTLTRSTAATILRQLKPTIFDQFKRNPENFISEAIRFITEQKATAVIEQLSYDLISEQFDTNIFTKAQMRQDFSKAGKQKEKHIFDYLITESKTEQKFADKLDSSSEVVVYAKLPRGFYIPTPVGEYNPDWAIAFDEGKIKHIYFVAETKGSMSTMELREIEKIKISCAQKFFHTLNERIGKKGVKYDVVDSYEKLMDIVGLK